MDTTKFTRLLNESKSKFRVQYDKNTARRFKIWTKKTLFRSKYYTQRKKILQKLQSTMYNISDSKNWRQVLTYELASIRNTANAIDQILSEMQTPIDLLEDMKLNHQSITSYLLNTQPINRYIHTSILELLHHYKCTSIDLRCMQRLRKEEDIHKDTQYITQITPGSYTRTMPYTYPITDTEVKLLAMNRDELCGNETRCMIYEKYVQLVFEDETQVKQILIPFLQEIIPMVILCKLNKLPLPILNYISTVEERPYDTFVFAAACFFGTPTQTKQFFACCQFIIDHQTYSDVWIELPLLLNTPAYVEMARVAYQEHIVEPTKDAIEAAETIPELIQIDPGSAFMKRLHARYLKMT